MGSEFKRRGDQVGADQDVAQRPIRPGKQTRVQSAARNHVGAPSPAAGPQAPFLSVLFAPTAETVRRQIVEARGSIQVVESTLIPAFRNAVDALDVGAVLHLARSAVEGFRRARTGVEQSQREVDALERYNASQASQRLGPVTDDAEPSEDSAPPPALRPAPESAEGEADVAAEVETLEADFERLSRSLILNLSVQLFRGKSVTGRTDVVAPHQDVEAATIREASIVADILVNVSRIRQLLGDEPGEATEDARKEAASLVIAYKSRPVNFRFFRQVLVGENLWSVLETQLKGVNEAVQEQAVETGNFTDVGEWDAGVADFHMRLFAGEKERGEVLRMVMSASGEGRARLVHQLDRAGTLRRLCTDLPWGQIKQWHDSIEEPKAKEKLRGYFSDKGGGESVSQMFEGKIMENLEGGEAGVPGQARAFGWTVGKTAYSSLTGGFADAHDQAYEAKERGDISNSSYLSASGKALGRSVAVMGASMATGGAAGAWGEGLALGLGRGRTAASIIGGGIGGAVGGVGGVFAGDVFDMTVDGKQGLSSVGDYGKSALVGAAGGALTAALPAAATRYFPRVEASAKTMAQVYGERFPGLDNLMTRLRNSGIRSGLRVRVTGQELALLKATGLVGSGQIEGALERMATVFQHQRFDSSKRLSKVHPQSEIESYFGPVDRDGNVDLQNPAPTEAGYAAVTDQIPLRARQSKDVMRETLGVDGDNPWYKKYGDDTDPLFEVVFRVRVELDVPLPQTEARGRPVGAMDPGSNHVAGAGRTSGGVQEGKVPSQMLSVGGKDQFHATPIEVLEIRPVGEAPTGGYQSKGGSVRTTPVTGPFMRGGVPVVGGAVGGSPSAAMAEPRKD